MPARTPRFNIAPKSNQPRFNATGGYDGQWRKLRDRRINAEPLCRHCSAKGFVTPAVEVDHIKPKALGGMDTWDNTQSLCSECHKAKTRQDIRNMPRGFT